MRSVAQHTYADVRRDARRRCCARSASAGWRSSARAAACASPSPSRRSSRRDGSWTVRYRVPLATEDYNAQISLLTGMAAAALMLRAGTGILRTQPPAPDERSLARLRRQARALGVAVAGVDALPRVRAQPRPRRARATPR